MTDQITIALPEDLSERARKIAGSNSGQTMHIDHIDPTQTAVPLFNPRSEQ